MKDTAMRYINGKRTLPSLTVTLMTFFLASCDGGDADPMAADGSSSSAGETSLADTTEGNGTDPYACVETSLEVTPLFGPGWNSETNTLLEATQETYVVHTTQAMLSTDYAAEFEALSNAVVEQLMTTPGLIAVGFATEPNCGFVRTTGIWESEAAMYRFVGSGAHAQAMAQTASLELSGRVTHFDVAASDLPVPWETIISRIGEVDPFGYP